MSSTSARGLPPLSRENMEHFLAARVADYMTSPVMTLAPGATLAEIERQFAAFDFNAFPVLEDGDLAGMVTKFDALKVFLATSHAGIRGADEVASLTAAEIMTRDVITFPPLAPLTRVLQTLVDFRVKSFPVVDARRVVGIIARNDLVRALRQK